MVVYWMVKDLVDAGAISTKTTSLTVRAETTDGGKVIGSDVVSVTKK